MWGESTLRVNPFSIKKVMHNENYNIHKLKSWWYHLTILNISKKLKNLHDNILELKVHFESKLILIQQLNEKDWIKLM
jgi:hypothetical protein